LDLNKTTQENHYKGDEIDFDEATRKLHELSHKWLALSQDLKILQAQLDFLRDGYPKLEEALQKGTKSWSATRTANVENVFDVLRSQCDICVRWSQTYRERTEIHINRVSEPNRRLENHPLETDYISSFSISQTRKMHVQVPRSLPRTRKSPNRPKK
jgi:hypothetical protein